MCRYCGSRELRWTSASTAGTVVAAVLTHRTSRDALRPLLPYLIAVVRMDDGPLVLGTAVLGAEAPRAGGRVEIDPTATSSSGVLTFGEIRET
jgi:uncharacterized OB-fold protein